MDPQSSASVSSAPSKSKKKIGVVAYELALPANARIHPVFHISKLKPFYGSPPTQTPNLEPEVIGTLVELQPSEILGHRTVCTPQGDRRHILVRWKGLPIVEATWEDEARFSDIYPNHNLEDKVVSEGQGNDTKLDKSDVVSLGNGLNGSNTLTSERPKRIRKGPRWLEDFV